MPTEENDLRKILKLPPLTQVGIVVPDLEETVTY